MPSIWHAVCLITAQVVTNSDGVASRFISGYYMMRPVLINDQFTSVIPLTA